MDEVCDDGRPHEAEKIEDLSLYNHQLQKNTNSKRIISWRWYTGAYYLPRVLNFKIKLIYFDKLLTKACQRIEQVLVTSYRKAGRANSKLVT